MDRCGEPSFLLMNRTNTISFYHEPLPMEAHTALRLNIIEKLVGQKGFAVIPKRWVVERSIAWTGRNRLASREYNCNATSSESFIYLGSIAMLLNRLYPKE